MHYLKRVAALFLVTAIFSGSAIAHESGDPVPVDCTAEMYKNSISDVVLDVRLSLSPKVLKEHGLLELVDGKSAGLPGTIETIKKDGTKVRFNRTFYYKVENGKYAWPYKRTIELSKGVSSKEKEKLARIMGQWDDYPEVKCSFTG